MGWPCDWNGWGNVIVGPNVWNGDQGDMWGEYPFCCGVVCVSWVGVGLALILAWGEGASLSSCPWACPFPALALQTVGYSAVSLEFLMTSSFDCS